MTYDVFKGDNNLEIRMRGKAVRKISLAVIAVCALFFRPAVAEDLKSAILTMIETDNGMKMVNADIEAARLKKWAAFGEMLPTVNIGAQYGSSDLNWEQMETNYFRITNAYVGNTLSSGTNYYAYTNRLNDTFEHTSVRLVQPLILFGQNAVYRRARAVYQRSCSSGLTKRQELIQNGMTAYLRLKQAEKDLEYAKASVDNIKKQTEMEDSRVAKGGGVSTDVLQSKTQLLRAQAQLMRAEGQLIVVQNTVERVFSRPASVITNLEKSDLMDVNTVPSDLAQAEAMGLVYNPYLKVAELTTQIASADYSASKFVNFPRMNGVVEANWRNNFGGMEGWRSEQLAKIEFMYEFNLGLSTVNEARAARRQVVAAEERVLDIKKQVLEQVRNSWQSLLTARQTARVLREQEAVAEEFLTLARKERTLGRRSLLDVLNGEILLINARSEAASAEAETEISTYQLLRAIGVLDIGPDMNTKKTR